MKKCLLALIFSVTFGLDAHAFGYVYVSNMSLLSWQLTLDGRVYLRNLSQFDSSFLGCCYNYYIDTTTPAGKAIWSTVLLKMASGQPMYLGLSDPSQPGQIEQVGIW